MVKQRHVDKVRDTKEMEGADCETCHVMVRSRMMIKKKLQHYKSGSKPPHRLNTDLLKYQKAKRKLSKEMDETLEQWNAENDLEQKRKQLKEKSICNCQESVKVNDPENIRTGLRSRIWKNRHVSIRVKCQVY